MLYHRENGSLSDSTGIAVYLPCQVDNYSGLINYLDYVYDIVYNDNIRVLYYYKQAGCLNDELTEYVKSLTDNELRKLDLKLFNDFTRAEPVVGDGTFSLPVREDLQNLMVIYYIEVANLDEKEGIITDYGSNGGLELDGNGYLISNFDGKWPYIDNVPLYVEVVSNTASGIEFKSHINHNGDEAYLILNYDKDTEKLTVNSVRKVEEGDANFMDNTKSNLQLENGDTITPLYKKTDLTDESESLEGGKTVKIKSSTEYMMKTLPKGYYIGTVVITDPRGDRYYSAVLGADIGTGGVKGWKTDDRFKGSSY